MPNPDNIPIIGPMHRATTDLQRDQIPILGSYWHAMNAIVDFVEYGCYPNWTVWASTLVPVLGTAIIQVFSFGVGDILRGYFRPTNLRGLGGFTRVPVRGEKGKAGKKGKLKRFSEPPEIGNEIGKKLPGSEMIRGRKVTGAEEVFWVVDTKVERVLWWWLIADVTDDFITNWTTAIMESEACRDEGSYTVSAHRDNQGPYVPDQWQAVIGWTIDAESGGSRFNELAGTLAIGAGMRATITMSVDAEGWAGGLCSAMDIGIGILQADDTFTYTTPNAVLPADNPLEPGAACYLTGPMVAHLAVRSHGAGLGAVRHAVMTATVSPI